MQKKNRVFPYRLCAVVGLFACFAAMYCFTAPELDVFLFAQRYGPDLRSVVAGAADYGNGRFLGNVLGFFFSRHYAYAFLCMALCMTGIVWAMGRVFFRGNARMLFPLALCVAFPSMKMTQDVYGVFAAFVNYACPVLFLLLSAALLARLRDGGVRPVGRACSCAALFLCATAAALFSENTTVVLLCFAVLWMIDEKMQTHTVSAASVLHLLGAVCGGLVMLILPAICRSAHKLDDYRGTVFGSVSSLVRGTFGGVLRTCAVVHTFVVPIALLCVGMLLALRHAAESRAVRFARAVFIVYPLLALGLTLGDLLQPFSRALQALHLLPALCLAAAVLIAVRALPDRSEKRRNALFCLLFLSSVVPMLFITQYGFRTYYITFFVLTAWGLYLLRGNGAVLRKKLQSLRLQAKGVGAACCCVFVLLAGVYTMQSAINFDVYAIRTGQIEQALRDGDAQIVVPLLPCRYLSGEEQWPYSVSMALPPDARLQIEWTCDLSSCRDAESYRAVYGGSPVFTLRFAMRNLRVKDPLILADTIEKGN